MSIAVINKKGQFLEFSGHGWTMYLRMAELYGWQPAGTKKPQGYGFFKKWNGCYDVSYRQMVVNNDAANLSMAIKNALNCPEFDNKIREMEKQEKEHVSSKVSEEIARSLEISFDKVLFADFANFCDNGEFCIE